MKILEVKSILRKQIVFKKSSWGFDLSNKALSFVDSTLKDSKNHDNEAVQCSQCGIVISMLLSQNGCPNCGYQKFTTKIIQWKD